MIIFSNKKFNKNQNNSMRVGKTSWCAGFVLTHLCQTWKWLGMGVGLGVLSVLMGYNFSIHVIGPNGSNKISKLTRVKWSMWSCQAWNHKTCPTRRVIDDRTKIYRGEQKLAYPIFDPASTHLWLERTGFRQKYKGIRRSFSYFRLKSESKSWKPKWIFDNIWLDP